MKKGNWVPLDKTLVDTMSNINRPFSPLEAMFSYSVDQDNGKDGTLRGYAKLWGWSVGKVKRFVECLRNTSETVVERKGNGSGTLVRFVDGSLKRLAEQKRNSSGTVAERKQVGTIYPNPNPNPKEKKKTMRFTPPTIPEVKSYCLERKNGVDPVKFVNHYQAVDWMRGKNKIKCWKSCVRTWEGNQKESPGIANNKKCDSMCFSYHGCKGLGKLKAGKKCGAYCSSESAGR